jgi:hypothetical protein
MRMARTRRSRLVLDEAGDPAYALRKRGHRSPAREQARNQPMRRIHARDAERTTRWYRDHRWEHV